MSSFRRTTRTTRQPGKDRTRRAAVERLECRTLLSAGDLDPTFSGDGKVLAEDVLVDRAASDVAVLADGKVLVVGYRSAGRFGQSGSDLELTRYNADGTLDTSFGDGGRVRTDLGGIDYPRELAIDSQGRMVVGANTRPRVGASGSWAVVRYLASGALDASFGNGGKTVLDFSAHALNALSVAPGDKVVAAGRSAESEFTVVRLNGAGALDSTFGGDGIVTTSFGNFWSQYVNDVAAMPDGRVVALGSAVTQGQLGFNQNVVLARYNADGSLDTSFDGDGKVLAADRARHESARALALYPDGRVVVAGETSDGGGGKHTLWRFLADGRPDASFGNAGFAANDLVPDRAEFANDTFVTAEGRIVTAGGVLLGPGPVSYSDYLVTRSNADGTLDRTFDGDGWAATDFGGHESAQGVAPSPGGDVVAVGGAEVGPRPFEKFDTLGVVRHNPDGSRDAGFGADGKVLGRIEGYRREVNDVQVQPDRKVLVAGSTHTGANVDFFLARYNADGSLDRSFGGGDGIVVTDFFAARVDVAQAILVQGDGKIVVAGTAGVVPGPNAEPLNDVALARFTPDGTLDTSFGGDGRVRYPLAVAAGQTNEVGDLDAYPGGKVLVSGGFGVARLNPDGSLDTSFGGDGTAGPTDGFVAAIAVQGTKVVATRANSVVRYNADGSRDATFTEVELPPGEWDPELEVASEVYDVELAPDGDLLVMGLYDDSGDSETEKIVLWRLNPDGLLDAAWGTNGRLVTPPAQTWDATPRDMEVYSDGRIVVSGSGKEQDLSETTSVVVRYLPDGRLDTSFDLDGWSYLRGGQVGFSSIAIDPTGDVVAAGDLHRDRPGYGVVRIDGAGDAGNVSYDRFGRVLVVKGNLTGDTISLGASRGRVLVNFNGRTTSYLRSAVDKVLVYGRDGNDSVHVSHALSNLSVRGGLGDDTLRGGPGDESLSGGDGNDLIDGGLGADGLAGGAGRDTLDYRSRTRPVTVHWDGPYDSGEAGEGDNVGFDFEIIYGGAGDDHIGLPTAGVIYAGPGNDALHGSFLDDALWGQEGDDLLHETEGVDYFRGGSGTDTVSYAYDNDFSYGTIGSRGPVVADIDGVADDGEAGGAEGDNVYTDVENLIGGPADDVLTGSSADNRIEGGGGDDVLTGLAGDDTLLGGEGDDTLNDTQGANTLDGGPGTDTINGVPEGPTSVPLQAEDARMEGARPASLNSGYTGTGYADYANASGDWVEWTVNATGPRTLKFRYANGSASIRPLTLSINGDDVVHMSFDPTGSWSTWNTIRVQVTLSGPSTIRLTSTGYNGPNIDSLIVEPILA